MSAMKGKYLSWSRGDDEALLNRHGGEEGARAFIRGDFNLVPRDPEADLLLPQGEPVVLPGVQRFVAADAITKANGFVFVSENARNLILPVVEENVPAATLTVSDLTAPAKDVRIYVSLDVDKKGEVALAHFLEVLKSGKYTWLASYVSGADGETWVVGAYLFGEGWRVRASQLGGRYGWGAGSRFLSR